MPRDIVFWGAIWLLSAIALGIGIQSPIEPSVATYEPAASRTALLCAAGVVVGWPLLRLGSCSPRNPLHAVTLDFLTIASMLQLVLWPIRLVTSWSVRQCVTLDMTLLAHAACIGAVLVWGTGSRSALDRGIAMVLCLAIGVGTAGFAAAQVPLAEAWGVPPGAFTYILGGGLSHDGALVHAAGTASSLGTWIFAGLLLAASLLALRLSRLAPTANEG